MGEVGSELARQDQTLLGEAGRHLEEHLSALTEGWERTLADILAAQSEPSRALFCREAMAAAQAFVRALSEEELAAGWEAGRAFGEKVALERFSHALLAEWLLALRQSLFAALSRLCVDGQGFARAAALGELFATYILQVTEGFGNCQQRLLLEQEEELRQACEQARRRVAQLSAVQQVGLKLAKTAEPSAVLDEAVRATMELLQPNEVVIFLYDPAKRTFSVGSSLNDAGEQGFSPSMPRAGGPTAGVVHTGQLVAIEDLASYVLYQGDLEQAGETRSIASVPLVRAGEVLGVLQAIYRVPHRFTEEEIGLVQMLADQAAVAVASAHMSRRMEEMVRELQETTDTQSQLLHLIHDLSTPIVPLLEGVLLMPIVGNVDSERGRQILGQLLQVVEEQGARVVLVDITGVPVVDTSVAQILFEAVHAVQLLGGEVVLVGIRPEVAQTLVSLGVSLAGITTRASLQAGLSYAIGRIGRKQLGASISAGLGPQAGSRQARPSAPPRERTR